jgi:hypothetical protein
VHGYYSVTILVQPMHCFLCLYINTLMVF